MTESVTTTLRTNFVSESAGYRNRNKNSPDDDNYNNGVVCASIWLLFYSLMAGGVLMIKQGPELATLVSVVLAQ